MRPIHAIHLLPLCALLTACAPSEETSERRSPSSEPTAAVESADQSAPIAQPAAPRIDPQPAIDAYRAGDYPTALPLLETAAEAGHDEARFLLGEAHLRGHGTPRNYAQARHWLTLAGEANHPEAQYRLAEMHAYGYGGRRDLVAANEWQRRARENGWGAATENE